MIERCIKFSNDMVTVSAKAIIFISLNKDFLWMISLILSVFATAKIRFLVRFLEDIIPLTYE